MIKDYIMALEVFGGWVAKLGWVLILPYLGWLHRNDKIKLDNTFTKVETSSLIDLKMAPLEQKIDNQSRGLHDKFDLLLDLVKSDNEKNTSQRKENNQMLHTISKDVAVIRNEVDNLKDRVSENK